MSDKIKSTELVHYLRTPAKFAKAKDSLLKLYQAAEREYRPLDKPQTSFPSTPGEGGLANNDNLLANWLHAWWFFGDKNALESAKNCLAWLKSVWSEKDRAHCQRNVWIPAATLAITEEDPFTEINEDEYLDLFWSWYRYCDADPYVNQRWTGSTLRPFIRIHGSAVHTAYVAEKLSNADIHPDFVIDPDRLRTKATESLEKWALTKHTPTSRWGFMRPTNGPIHGEWYDFPYIDGKDWHSSTSNMTWFMAGSIVPEEAAAVRLYLSASEWGLIADTFGRRARQMASHAIDWGIRNDTLDNMKALGKEKPGCFAPPGKAIGAPEFGPNSRNPDLFEPGYYGGIALGFYASDSNKNSRADNIVRWCQNCRAIEAGQVPWGIVVAAMNLSL